jgi:hypothetical protein
MGFVLVSDGDLRMRKNWLAISALLALGAPGNALAQKHSKQITITCDHETFEFYAGSASADVVDKNYSREPLETMAKMAETPKAYSFAWTRKSLTALGEQRIDYEVYVNKTSGAQVKSYVDRMPGAPVTSMQLEGFCKISP